MSGRRKLAIGLCGVLGGVLAAMVHLRDQGPVLFRVNPDLGAVRPRYYCVLNPFRERAPEVAAEDFMMKLRAGRREELNRLVDAERRAHILMREAQYPIRAWRMCWRSTDRSGANLGYWVTREHYEGEEEIWLDLSYKGRWIVTGFNAIY